MGVNPDEKSSSSAIDIYQGQVEDALLHEYRECLARSEG